MFDVLYRLRAYLTIPIAMLALSVPCRATAFQILNPSTLTREQYFGVFDATQEWQSLLLDPIIIRFSVSFTDLGSCSAGRPCQVANTPSPPRSVVSYAAARDALVDDRRTPDDSTAVAHLQPGPAITIKVSDPQKPSSIVRLEGDSTFQSTLYVAQANLKALHMASSSDLTPDFQLEFGKNVPWDFDRRDGITAGKYDFVGVAMHEMAHGLGFQSGVVALAKATAAGNFSLDELKEVSFLSVLDLYRYSPGSMVDGGIPAFVVDGQPLFVIDPTKFTNIPGVFCTDERAAHWCDTTPGLMDWVYFERIGTKIDLAPRDLRALDVIGYDAKIPEPGTITTVALGIIVLSIRLQRQRILGKMFRIDGHQ